MRAKKTAKLKKIEGYANWLALEPEERDPRTKNEFALSIGVSPQTLFNWEKGFSQTDEVDEVAKFRKHLYKEAMKAGASAKVMELYAKLKGLLIERTETKVEIGLSANEITRRNFEADNRLRQFRQN